MYLGVDIGGTKTLVAPFSASGKLQEEIKFPTPPKYEDFIKELASTVANLSTRDFRAVGVGGPGRIDREHGIGLSFGNLGWKNVHIEDDLEKMFNSPVILENDAKLAGLSEAKLVKEQYKRVVYVTISTGIGIALIVNGSIDTKIGDRGGKAMVLEHNGVMKPWEDFASGKAIVERFGKRASEINDETTWKILARDFSVGIIELIAVLSPEVIIIGGGVGTHFKKYGEFLIAKLKLYETPMLSIPPILPAQRPEDAVIYGCYLLAKEHYDRTH